MPYPKLIFVVSVFVLQVPHERSFMTARWCCKTFRLRSNSSARSRHRNWQHLSTELS